MAEITISVDETADEGKRLAEIIRRDGRTLRVLGPLLGVRFEELSSKRLSQTKRLGQKLATSATKLFGLPLGHFQASALPEGLEHVPVDEYKISDPLKEINSKLDRILELLLLSSGTDPK